MNQKFYETTLCITCYIRDKAFDGQQQNYRKEYQQIQEDQLRHLKGLYFLTLQLASSQINLMKENQQLPSSTVNLINQNIQLIDEIGYFTSYIFNSLDECQIFQKKINNQEIYKYFDIPKPFQRTRQSQIIFEELKSNIKQLEQIIENQNILELETYLKKNNINQKIDLMHHYLEQAKSCPRYFIQLNTQTSSVANDYEEIMNVSNQDIMYSAQISQSGQYLVYCCNEQKVLVYDLWIKQKLYELDCNQIVAVFRFSDDSNLLTCGCDNGYFHCYDLQDNFKLIFSQELHDDCINDIKFISNYQIITCSQDKQIIITDMQNKTNIMKIQNSHDSSIQAIDYDQVLVSCSNDQTIKIFDQQGKLLIQEENPHKDFITQIQLLYSMLERVIKYLVYGFKVIKIVQIMYDS
ncbi:DDB1- and CUL4-associated factor 10 [Paramecium bursaria]